MNSLNVYQAFGITENTLTKQEIEDDELTF